MFGSSRIPHRFHRRHGEEEHHDRAVHGEELVVQLGPDEIVLRHRELDAHDEREDAGEDEEHGDAPTYITPT
jgi:hypothetical protein